jgi:hypothetical protein
MKLVQRILKDLGGTKIAKLFSMVHVFLTRLIYQRQTGDNFYLTRVQKRNLVNFLSEKFLELAQSKCHEKNCIVVTSGGFEGANKDKAFGSSPEKGILNVCNFPSLCKS